MVSVFVLEAFLAVLVLMIFYYIVNISKSGFSSCKFQVENCDILDPGLGKGR